MTLQASGLAMARGNRVLFEGLSFELQAGQALYVRGANGSGKSSLLRVLAGLSQALRGQLTWRGRPLESQRDAWLTGLVYCGHASALKSDLLAWENLSLTSALSGTPCSETQACAALDRLGLSKQARLPVAVLSQGQRKRLSLARVFLSTASPTQLLLDEPFDALDAASVNVLKTRLVQLLAAGAQLVYTTHQPQVLDGLNEQVLDLPGARP